MVVFQELRSLELTPFVVRAGFERRMISYERALRAQVTHSREFSCTVNEKDSV